MFDGLQLVFWSLAYLAIVVYSIKYRSEKQIFMPFIPGMLNFTWELNAFIRSHGFIGHTVWLVLDCLIIGYNFWVLTEKKKRLLYGAATVFCIVLFRFLFQWPAVNGMLLSSYAIDLIMAVVYVWNAKKVSRRGMLLIGIFKFLGDLFAWLHYKDFAVFVMVAGILVQLFNSIYLLLCIVRLKNPAAAGEQKNRKKAAKPKSRDKKELAEWESNKKAKRKKRK